MSCAPAAARTPRRHSALSESLEPRRLMAAYTVVDLGTLGGDMSWAYDLNNNNQVVGYSTTAAGEHRAFVFTDANANGVDDGGEMVNLGALAGDAASYAHGINDGGQVVGTSRGAPLGVDADERAVRFNPGGQPTDLGLGAGSNGYASNGLDVNASATIVGGTLSGFNYVPFVRSAGGTVTTFTLPTPYNSYGEARAINDSGAVVGYAGSFAGDSGFIRTAAGTLTPVGHANPALPYSYAWDVNNAGQVVGEGFNSAGDYRAFLWQNGSATDLGTLPGMGSSQAFGVNGAGAVVGRVEPVEGTTGPTRAFLYRFGAMRDLNTLIPNTGWFLADARAINDRGAIAVVGFSPAGQLRGVLLVPTPSAAHVFYNNSAFDGRNPAATAEDDAAIATDKMPLRPGQAARAHHITSYSRGINGVMIDLPALSGTPALADFEFRVGNGGDPGSWAPAPPPRGINVREGAGASGSDRVTITWDDGAIRNTWLQVTVRPTATTGGWSSDVFSFGNLIGEVPNAPAMPAPFVVNALDVLATRRRLAARGVPITEPSDFNRDRRVDVLDYAIVRRNYGAQLEAPASPAASVGLASVPSARTDVVPLRRTSLRDLLR